MSSHLITRNPEFERLCLVRIPNRPTKAIRAVRQDGTIIIDMGNNKFAVCREVSSKDWAYPMSFRSWPWQRHFLRVMGKLGLFSKEAVEAEVKATEQKDERRQIQRDNEELARLAKRYRFKAPKLK